jgi:hypothetical protein
MAVPHHPLHIQPFKGKDTVVPGQIAGTFVGKILLTFLCLNQE